jgi:uncharacterized membrane protein
MIRLLLLCLILIAAGLVHLLDPFSFINGIPSFIPFKLEVIFWTGILEFILAVGLILPKSRSLTSKITAFYFFLLLPIHLYVSWNVIPMFGISDPVILWFRTLFQFVFIWWAYSLRKV